MQNPTSSNYGLGGRGGSEVAMLLNSADGPLSSSSNNTAAYSSTTSLLKGKGSYRALLIVGSMGSFEPMDFWELLNLTHYYS